MEPNPWTPAPPSSPSETFCVFLQPVNPMMRRYPRPVGEFRGQYLIKQLQTTRTGSTQTSGKYFKATPATRATLFPAQPTLQQAPPASNRPCASTIISGSDHPPRRVLLTFPFIRRFQIFFTESKYFPAGSKCFTAGSKCFLTESKYFSPNPNIFLPIPNIFPPNPIIFLPVPNVFSPNPNIFRRFQILSHQSQIFFAASSYFPTGSNYFRPLPNISPPLPNIFPPIPNIFRASCMVFVVSIYFWQSLHIFGNSHLFKPLIKHPAGPSRLIRQSAPPLPGSLPPPAQSNSHSPKPSPSSFTRYIP